MHHSSDPGECTVPFAAFVHLRAVVQLHSVGHLQSSPHKQIWPQQQPVGVRAGCLHWHFWATSCGPCRAELPTLLQMARAQSNVQLIAVSTDNGWGPVLQFFAGSVPAEVFRDPAGSLVRQLGVHALPDTFLLDRDGVPRFRIEGAQDWGSDAAIELLTTTTSTPQH